MMRKSPFKHFSFHTFFLLLLLLFSYFFGAGVGFCYNKIGHHVHDSDCENWGLCFREKGKPPEANASPSELAKYDAYFRKDTEEKILYLTFDAGYENGNTGKILDALKKHHTPATFFAVGPFIKSNPELVKRMVDEGHLVGNHTWHHPDLSQISTKESFQKELGDVEQVFKETTGKELGYKTFFGVLPM